MTSPSSQNEIKQWGVFKHNCYFEDHTQSVDLGNNKYRSTGEYRYIQTYSVCRASKNFSGKWCHDSQLKPFITFDSYTEADEYAKSLQTTTIKKIDGVFEYGGGWDIDNGQHGISRFNS